MSRNIVIGAVVLALLVAGVGGWWYLRQPRITVSPTSGPAPLTVTFSIQNDVPGLTFDFGEQNQRRDTVPGGYAHTYTKAGVHIATVKQFPHCSSWECYGMPKTIKTFTITVTEPLAPARQTSTSQSNDISDSTLHAP